MEEEEKEETITVSEIIQKDKQITEEAQHQKSQNPGNEESCTYDEGPLHYQFQHFRLHNAASLWMPNLPTRN